MVLGGSKVTFVHCPQHMMAKTVRILQRCRGQAHGEWGREWGWGRRGAGGPITQLLLSVCPQLRCPRCGIAPHTDQRMPGPSGSAHVGVGLGDPRLLMGFAH